MHKSHKPFVLCRYLCNMPENTHHLHEIKFIVEDELPIDATNHDVVNAGSALLSLSSWRDVMFLDTAKLGKTIERTIA